MPKKPLRPPSPPPPIDVEAQSPIRDVRDKFARKTPQTDEDALSAERFIAGKIEMVKRDPYLSEQEKTAAIASLNAQRSSVGRRRGRGRRRG